MASDLTIRPDKLLTFDPSGAFEEGKGTSGWCLADYNTNKFEDVGNISAIGCSSDTEYWEKHLKLIALFSRNYDLVVLVEDYLLYAQQAMSQVNSRFETSQLIGVMKFYAAKSNIPFFMQTAAQVKPRWTNHILLGKGIIYKRRRKLYLADTDTPIDRHELDAIRHAVHYLTFYKE